MFIKPRQCYNRIWAAGYGLEGQLNNNCAVNQSSPVWINGKIWRQIEIGKSSFGITEDNELYSWGLGTFSILGTGSNSSRSSPVQLPGSDWLCISQNNNIVAALKQDCSLWVWGSNLCGALGLNLASNVRISTPTQLSGNWKEIKTGVFGMAGIRVNGDLYTWGKNEFGELGDNTITYRSSPVFIGSGFRKADISCTGASFIKEDGSLWVTGRSRHQVYLGNPCYGQDKSSPVQVPGNWICASAGDCFVIGIDSNNDMWAWGTNGNGRTGVGLTVGALSCPVQIPGKWDTLSSKTSFSSATKTNGSLYTWGTNCVGQLGIGNTDDQSSPIQILGRYKSVSSGFCNITMAIEDCLYEHGKVYIKNRMTSVGHNQWGQLGNNNAQHSIDRVNVCNSGNFVTWSSFDNTAYGLTANGELYGWGRNHFGQVLPIGEVSVCGISTPTQIPGNWCKFTAGYSAGYGIKEDESLWVWGYDESGQLGTGNTFCYSSPIQIPGSWKCVWAGVDVAAGMKSDGTVWVWGRNTCGILGLGDVIARSSPVQLPGNWLCVSLIGLSQNHSMGLRTDCTLWVWGHWLWSMFGSGCAAGQSVSSPVQIPGHYIHINVGEHANQAIDTDCNLWAWGLGNLGAIGNNSNETNISTPVQIPGKWVCVGGTRTSSFGIKDGLTPTGGGDLWVWGRNGFGELGLGDTSNRSSPVQIPGKYAWVGSGSNTSWFVEECTWKYNKEHYLRIASINDVAMLNKQGCWSEYVPEIDE